MKGRKPQPTEIKKRKGVWQGRINSNEPEFENAGLMSPPNSLDKVAKDFWRDIFPELHKNDVIKKTDIPAFIVLCKAYSDVMKLGSTAKLKTFMSCASEFGITPSSRGRLSGAGPQKPGGGLRDFMIGGLKNGRKRS